MHVEYVSRRLRGEVFITHGEISFGACSQSTVLGSCISLILHSEEKRVSGLSHIIGQERPGGIYSMPGPVAEHFEFLRERYGLDEAAYYLVGGTDRVRHPYDLTRQVLEKKGLPYWELDVLGDMPRYVCVTPHTSTVWIHYMKPLDRG